MDFSAANTTLWNFIIQLGIIAGILLISNVLRRKIPFVRKSLMPTAVLAGFIMLFFKMATARFDLVDVAFMESMTYHTIAIGFIALSLQIPIQRDSRYKQDFTVAKSGALIVSCYLLQGFAGLVITTALSYTIMPDLFKASGILLPMGFGQGPGQANNVGLTYEKLGFVGGQSFGLSLAAMGFLVACVVGVIYLNVLKRQGKVVAQTGEEISGSVTVQEFQEDNEIPVAESVDRLSIQFALVILAYLITFLVSFGVTTLLLEYAPGMHKLLAPLIWGFNFIIGSLVAVLIRMLLKSLRKSRIMTRQYQNNYLLGRIAGISFDLMVVGGIASINIAKLSGLWLAFALLSIAGTVFTFIYLIWICKKLYPNYFYEGFVSMYGMMTGTISSGVLLLREIDPSFKTPAANNLVAASGFAILLAIPMLILISLAPQSTTMLFVTIGLIAIYFFVLLLFMLKARRRQS
ncbi:MAG: sodium/glutamate symporter family protein [Saccharofermentanales bacterium]